MSDVIRTVELTKHYGNVRGVELLSFSVPEGSKFGFLGPNGSGKTTTIRCLLDLLKPTSGETYLFGEKVGAHGAKGAALRGNVGYIAGEVHFYEHETCRWHIGFVESLRDRAASSSGELIERLELDTSRKVGELSKGNRQKLALVIALMHNPRLLILDEPTAALDPLNQAIVFDIISERIERGATLFLSSHILSEVERICSRIAIVRNGRLVVEDDVEKLLDRRLRRAEITFVDDISSDYLSGIPGVKDVYLTAPNVLNASIPGGEVDALLKRISERKVADIVIGNVSLEDVFLEFYTKDDLDEGDLDEDGGAAR